jgi:hypothetical protein
VVPALGSHCWVLAVMTCRRWSPILVQTRTAKLGIEVVPPRGADRATSQTAVGGGDVAAAIAVAPVGGGAWPAVQQSLSADVGD